MRKFYDMDTDGTRAANSIELPYFTKYLPVEGEIKKGDMAQIHSHVFKVVNLPFDGVCKKVKLFLCSRDIKVGDMVYPPVEEGYDPNVPMLCIEDGIEPPKDTAIVRISWAIEGKWYKKVGEISPDVTWLTEGVELSEDDIERWWYHNDFYVRYLYAEKLKHNGEFKIVTKVKGPCGHYH